MSDDLEGAQKGVPTVPPLRVGARGTVTSVSGARWGTLGHAQRSPAVARSRLLNEQPVRSRGHWPRYVAVELVDEPGLFGCRVRGPGLWSASQLEVWAVAVGAEIELVEWVRPAVGQLPLMAE